MLRVLQCVALCCSIRCSMLQYAAACCSVLRCAAVRCSVLQYPAVCCSVLQRVAVCCSEFQCVVVCCSVLQQVAVRCGMLQCVAMRCSGRAPGALQDFGVRPVTQTFMQRHTLGWRCGWWQTKRHVTEGFQSHFDLCST